MPLFSGTRLGPYQIEAPVGAGGMGEVYRAKDTRLDRVVAIKVLPSDLSRSPERRQRLEREARAISALSHPHICTLYDIGHQDGVDYLVMEYLEGETLEERLRKGPLPLNQVLRYGVEIADALSKAHAKGIVHRDLKPGNIMLTRSGAKLLDFGLARVMKQPAPVVGLAGLATETMRLTEEGVIVGTWQYMAPEQLEGGETDAPTDIFALGTVLYEMATGRPAFSGKTQVSLIAAILSSRPPAIASLQSMSPPALDHVLKKCLEKDPQERWQSAHDLRSELQWIAELPPEGGGLPAQATRPRLWQRLVISIAALVLVALLWMGFNYWRALQVTPRAIVRFSIPPPEKTSLDDDVALSPDGRWLAFGAIGADKQRKIWLRSLDSEIARPLPGTDNADVFFFWSPDSRYIGFFRDGKLKRVDVSSGFPEDLCAASYGVGATWNAAGVILFGANRSVQQINLADCAVKPVTGLDETRGVSGEGGRPSTAESSGFGQGYPTFLPDGRHFLYVARRASGLQQLFDIYSGALDSQNGHLVVRNGSMPFYTPPGYLVFERDGKLLAIAFDPKRLSPTGEPFPIVDERVEFVHGLGFASYSVSQNGLLAYQQETAIPQSQLQWVTRTGKQIGLVGPPGLYQRLRLSPDGKRIAVVRIDRLNHTGDFWIYEIARDTWTRFTFASSTGGGFAAWSPDGHQLAYRYGGPSDLFEKASDGSGNETILLPDGGAPDAWSPDGRYLVYQIPNLKTGMDLWVLPLFGDRKPISFLQTPFDEVSATISPDGRWIAYESNESGRWEVYVRPFLRPGPKWQVSSGGSMEPSWGTSTGPKWSSNRKELFYISLDRTLLSVPVRLGSTFQMDTPRSLFTLPHDSEYEPSPDGQRFLLLVPNETESPAPITVVLNWIPVLNGHK
jgi:eukaryotic-like serine/threonine-protein kinase